MKHSIQTHSEHFKSFVTRLQRCIELEGDITGY